MTERLEQPHDRDPRARGLEALQQEAERSRLPAKTKAGLQYRQDERVFVCIQTDSCAILVYEPQYLRLWVGPTADEQRMLANNNAGCWLVPLEVFSKTSVPLRHATWRVGSK